MLQKIKNIFKKIYLMLFFRIIIFITITAIMIVVAVIQKNINSELIMLLVINIIIDFFFEQYIQIERIKCQNTNDNFNSEYFDLYFLNNKQIIVLWVNIFCFLILFIDEKLFINQVSKVFGYFLLSLIFTVIIICIRGLIFKKQCIIDELISRKGLNFIEYSQEERELLKEIR